MKPFLVFLRVAFFTGSLIFLNGCILSDIANVLVGATPLAGTLANQANNDNDANATFIIGGSVSGLNGTVTLQDSVSGQTLDISVNGTYTFNVAIPTSVSFDISVLTQPAGQNCEVLNGTGTIGTADVTNIDIVCEEAPIAAGVVDTAFGVGGALRVGVANVSFSPHIAVNSQGDLAFSYSTIDFQGGGFENVITCLVNPDGTFDQNFNGGSCGVFDLGLAEENVRDVVVDANDNILTVGAASPTSGQRSMFAMRVTPQGIEDSSFEGGTVFVQSDCGLATPTGENAHSVAINPNNGKIVLAGSGRDGQGDPVIEIAQLEANGEQSQDFGDDGVVCKDTGSTISQEANSVLFDALGRIIFTGSAVVDSLGFRLFTERLLPGGDDDPLFAANGLLFDANLSFGFTKTAQAIDSQGRIYVSTESAGDFAIIRYTDGGVVDTTWGDNGIATFDIAGLGGENVVLDMAMDARENLILVGRSNLAGAGVTFGGGAGDLDDDGIVIRILSDGTLDSSFGLGGVIAFDGLLVDRFSDRATSVTIAPNGDIFVAAEGNDDIEGSDTFIIKIQ